MIEVTEQSLFPEKVINKVRSRDSGCVASCIVVTSRKQTSETVSQKEFF
jgi:hypothetical protein